jgi:lipoyl-dependent peroxiredoxin
MQIKRKATAVWNGTGKEGKGQLSSLSGVLQDTQYGFTSRFADGIGTNPEELIAAAHSGCFSMKLAFVLNEAGLTAEEINTTAVVILENGAINQIDLTTSVKAEGLTAEKLLEYATNAKENCPISKLLNANISLTTHLL